MLISAREAAGILAEEAGLSREPARKALQAGLAGAPQRARGSLLYDEERVRALAARASTTAGRACRDHRPTCRRGTFVARLSPDGDISQGWYVSPWVRVRMMHWLKTTGYVPMVATVSGFVVSGADISGVHPTSTPQGERTTFATAPPGAWFAEFDGRRFKTGPGGPWLLWDA